MIVVYVILLKSCFDYPPFLGKEFASRGNPFIFQCSKCRLTLMILTLHFQCWGWDTQHPVIVPQERAQLPKAEWVLQQFTCRQNAALRNFPCGFKICYLAWWFLKRCVCYTLSCMRGYHSYYSVCTDIRSTLCVSVANLQYHEFSLNTQVMMLPKGVIGPSSPSLTTYFHLHLCIGIGFWHPMVS